jgi:hypothetical protein
MQRNPMTGELTPISGLASPGGGGGALTPQQDTLAKAIAEYKQKMPTTIGKPMQMLIEAKVREYNPDYDSKDYDARQAVQKSYASGKDAEEIKAYNTVMGHLSEGFGLIDKVGNTRMSMVNALINPIRGQISPEYQRNVAKLGTVIDRAIEEVNKATTGAKITEGEHKEWREKLSINSAPETIKATYEEFMHLIASRMESSAEKYNNAMKLKPGDPGYQTVDTLLSDKAREQYKRIMGGGREAGGAFTVPKPNMTDDQLRKAAEAKVASGTPRPLVAAQMRAWGLDF